MNLLVYQRKGSNWQDDVQKAIRDSYEWIPLQQDTQRRRPNDRSRQGWQKPIHGFIKCSYDCSFSRNDLAPKAGWILWSDTGSYLLAAQGTWQLCNSVLEAELQALLMAMQHTWSKGYRKIIFEGDNRTVESLLNGNTRNFELHNLIIEIQHWRKKFSNAIIKWSFRSTNKAADRLAKGELENNVTFVSHSTR